MPGMMRYRNPQLGERLAAEYVLGTLQGAARRRFERLLAQSWLLQACVADWERRLEPLGAALTPLPPPPGLWPRIQQQITPRTASRAGLRDVPRQWWPLGLAVAGLVLVLSILLTQTGVWEQPTRHTAVIVNSEAQPVWALSGREYSRYIRVQTLRVPDVPPGLVCVLWLTWNDETFHSLGILPEGGDALITVPAHLERNLYTATVVVSMEPKERSRVRAPTGPVVFRGAWLALGD